mgnify:FL=1
MRKNRVFKSERKVFYDERLNYLSFSNDLRIFAPRFSGCSTVGSVPVWGAGGRVFESRQPDVKSGSSGFFYCFGFLCFHRLWLHNQISGTSRMSFSRRRVCNSEISPSLVSAEFSIKVSANTS